MNTRTIVAVIDDTDWLDYGATPEQIVKIYTAAGELHFADRDDVTRFEVIERQERFCRVQLPDNYDAEDQAAVRKLAWQIFCGESV